RLTGFEREISDFRIAGKAGGIVSGQVLFEHLKIFTFKRRQVMVTSNEGRRLEFMDQRVRFLQAPIGIGLVPHSVKPYSSNLTIVGEQFSKLRIHVVQVAIPVTAVGAFCMRACTATRVVVGMMPVELGVIEEQLDALAV